MSKHSPEPWEQRIQPEPPENSRWAHSSRNPVTIHGGPNGFVVAVVDRNYTPTNEYAEANAARIVACVNACAGINPEAVPEMLAMLVEARKWIGSMGTIAVNADTKTQKEFGQLMGAYKTLPARLNAVIKKAGFVPPSMKALPVDPSHRHWDYGSDEPPELSVNLTKLVTDPTELMKSLAESSKARVLAKVDARLEAEKETDDE